MYKNDSFFVDPNGVPDKTQLEKINKLSRRKLNSDEVYVFSLTLCDNETDRDYERFTVEALKAFEKLFICKTGIFDHSMKSRDQVARIFDCRVEKDGSRLTSHGEPYHRLCALAYIPRTAGNRDVILEIDAGIKKEVSVGCAVAVHRCSVCGADVQNGGCGHKKGGYYRRDGKKELCVTVLDQPTDAYEWSFVAVPAQPAAGVTKAYTAVYEGKNIHLEQLIKSLDSKENVTLSPCDAAAIASHIALLRKNESAVKAFYREQKGEVMHLTALVSPETDPDITERLVESLSCEQLTRYKKSLCKKMNLLFPPACQLSYELPENGLKKPEIDKTFII